MNKTAILKTGVCYWSAEDECFIVESSLFDRTAGTGKTPEQAWKHFAVMVDETLADIEKYGLYETPGRPAKGAMSIHVQVQPETRTAIKQMQETLELASQGDVLDYLIFFYNRLQMPGPGYLTQTKTTKNKTNKNKLKELDVFGVNVPFTHEQIEKLKEVFFETSEKNN